MATITPTIVEQVPGSTSPNGSSSASWSPLLNGDVGDKVGYHSHADRSVQVVGAFGAGGTVLIEGSLDGANWATLTDPQGVALSITSAKIKMIAEMTTYIRPRVSGGDGTTSLTVTLLARRQP